MTVVFATLGFTPEKLLVAVASVPRVEKVIFYTAHSHDTRKRSERAARDVMMALRQLGIECRPVVLRSPWNFLDILEVVLEDLAKHSDGDAIFNLTGGPKTMTVAATMASILIGIPLLYFPEKEEMKADPIHMPVLKLAYSRLLTSKQRGILEEIERRGGSVTGAVLHKALGITPATLQHYLVKLEKLGGISVAPLEEDRRHRVIKITQSGKLLLLAEHYVKRG